MSPRPGVSKLVTASLAPLMKTAGFRKNALTFERRRVDVTQIVDVQVSSGGRSFYVNIGLVFDAISALRPSESGSVIIGGRPVHFSSRLDELVPGVPPVWEDGGANAGDQIRDSLATVVATLDGIDGARAMLSAFPLDRGFDKVLRAQLKWTLGDRAGARSDLEAVAHEFSDRRGCAVEQLANRAGLGDAA